MTVTTGIIFAIVAMLAWGIGDFFIQRSTRTLGNWETLFSITAFGAIVLLPFVYNDVSLIFSDTHRLLRIVFFAGIIIFIASLLEFVALREGKLAVIEPIWSLEIPVAAFLAFSVTGEKLSSLQVVLVAALIIGLIFVSFRGTNFHAKHLLEKGAYVAVVAALCMGGANFIMGMSGRLTDPLVANFFANALIAVITLVYILVKGRGKKMWHDIRRRPKATLSMVILDNIAWIAFVAAMALAPIGIVTALTESYIIIVVVLGILINKEKLFAHQKVGLVIALVSAVSLAAVTG